MLVVSDVQDVFVPLLDGFLVKLSESEAMIDMYVLLLTMACLSVTTKICLRSLKQMDA